MKLPQSRRPPLFTLVLLPLVLAACNKPADQTAPPPGELPATATPDTATTPPGGPSAPAAPVAPDPAAPPPMETPVSDAAALLPTHHWRLTEATDAQGQRIAPLFVRADAPVQLDFVDNRLAVSNTCNRMSGGFALEGSTLTLSPVASTMMACADPKLAALDA